MTHASMTPPARTGRHVLLGGVRVLLAESLLIPTGLLTAAYLARRLGPDGYGVFTVAAAVVAWVEWSLTALFSRAAVRFVADAVDWRQIGATIVSVQLVLATAAALVLVVLAGPVAALLGTPALAGPLRLFAADVPLFCLAQAHRNILVGLGDFGERALAAAARWLSRLLLIVLFVELGWSIEGAVLGSIGASLIELAVCRVFVRPIFSVRATFAVGKLWGYAAPLLLSALALRLFDRLDLVMLTALGGTPEQAGHYGAAQNLAILPGLFATSFVPLLLSTLARAYRDHDGRAARRIGRDAIRWSLLLFPFAGLAAGSATGVVPLVFGQAFGPAAPLLAPLFFAAVALVLVSVTTAILLAAGHPGLTLGFTGPLPLVAAMGYAALIPRAGPQGAALVTLAGAAITAVALVLAVHRTCGIRPPTATLVRTGVLCAAAYTAAVRWPAAGAPVVIKLTVIGTGIVIAFLLTGELTAAELRAARFWRGAARR
ncbi:MAG: lipopolysaccharide biosynthesis protein [Gemmatimonadales bacterium]